MTYYLNDVSDPLTQVLMTYGVDGNYDAAYTYGLERINVEDIDETRPESQDPLYYLHDGLGSTTYLVKPDGNKRDHYRYDEYGKPAPGNSKLSEDGRINLNNTFGYTGEMWDEETDLLYLRARYYEPETGRFLSRDTYEGELGNPLSKNLYTYVQNNPVNYKDPSGNIPIAPILIYLGETALETIPDIMLDILIDGKSFNLGRSVFANYGFNLVPGLGESKKVKKVAKVTKMFGPTVAEYVAKHGDDLIKNYDKIIVAAKKSGIGGVVNFVKKRSQVVVKGTSNLAALRAKAVREAWKLEKKMVERTGKGTRNWTRAEKEELLKTGKVKGYEGHHINNVANNHNLAGDPKNVKFVKGRSQHLNEHTGNWQNPTSGDLIDR